MTEIMEHVPHPGSRLDRVASAAAQESPAHHAATQDTQDGPFVVQTRSDMPEEAIPRTLLLSANNPYLPILPRDMRRRRAVIIPISAAVVLCETKELAQLAAALATTGDLVPSAQEITPPNPGATTPLTYVLPYAATIRSITFTYTASATVSTRYVIAQIADAGGNVVGQVPVSSGTVASTSVQPFLSPTTPYTTSAEYASYAPVPLGGVLPAGYQIVATNSGGMVAGDVITGVRILLQPADGIMSAVSPGMYAPAGVPVVVESRDWMYAAVTTTGVASPVSVLAERYADPAAH